MDCDEKRGPKPRKRAPKLGFGRFPDNRPGGSSRLGEAVDGCTLAVDVDHMRILVATREDVLVVDLDSGDVARSDAEARPTCLAVDPARPDRAWCGTEAGVLRTDDGGSTWAAAGLADESVTAIAVSPEGQRSDVVVFAGTEPSAVWRSAGEERVGSGESQPRWERAEGLLELPSSSTWSFPPRPDTHHVRWIACDPQRPGRLYVAIEAGALVTTPDGGATWQDRPKVAPYDTHELAIHPERPEMLRVSAGDGYWESADRGGSWSSPEDGLEVTYLRSVAIDPGNAEVVVVSAATHAHKAYMAGRSDGRLYRREADGRWERVRVGWPDPPSTIAPLLAAGTAPGELWASDERGVHRSADGGRSWELAAAFDPTPAWLRGLAVVG
jgi:photosystem II stability/assembly factor-like uncharacterized protein